MHISKDKIKVRQLVKDKTKQDKTRTKVRQRQRQFIGFKKQDTRFLNQDRKVRLFFPKDWFKDI